MRDGYLALYVDQIPTTPGRCCSPNARCAWPKKAKEVKELREIARLAAVDAISRRNWARPLPESGPIALHWTLFLGHRERRRDWDNATGSLKGAIDGIFDALRTDDSRIVEMRVDQRRAESRMGWMQCAVVALDEESES